MTETFGTCTGLIGITDEELEALIATPQRSFAVPLEAAVAIPQMSRPYKGVQVVTQSFQPPRHYGADIGIPTGASIFACHSGRVVKAGWDSTGYGNVVVIQGDGVYTVYGHNSFLVARVGDRVEERQMIARSGSTGNSTGPHCHIELRVPPYGYPSSCVEPLSHMSIWTDAPTPPPPPTPTPTPTGWYQAKTTKQISCYSKPNISYPLTWPKLSAGVVFKVKDAGSSGNRDWVQLENGLYAMRKNKGKILMVKV